MSSWDAATGCSLVEKRIKMSCRQPFVIGCLCLSDMRSVSDDAMLRSHHHPRRFYHKASPRGIRFEVPVKTQSRLGSADGNVFLCPSTITNVQNEHECTGRDALVCCATGGCQWDWVKGNVNTTEVRPAMSSGQQRKNWMRWSCWDGCVEEKEG